MAYRDPTVMHDGNIGGIAIVIKSKNPVMISSAGVSASSSPFKQMKNPSNVLRDMTPKNIIESL